MDDSYLWNQTGTGDPFVVELERKLACKRYRVSRWGQSVVPPQAAAVALLVCAVLTGVFYWGDGWGALEVAPMPPRDASIAEREIAAPGADARQRSGGQIEGEDVATTQSEQPAGRRAEDLPAEPSADSQPAVGRDGDRE